MIYSSNNITLRILSEQQNLHTQQSSPKLDICSPNHQVSSKHRQTPGGCFQTLTSFEISFLSLGLESFHTSAATCKLDDLTVNVFEHLGIQALLFN